MRKMLSGAAAAALAWGGLVGPARADSVADVKAATQFFVTFARTTASGTSGSAAGVRIAKTAGTLDFDLPASALGIPGTATVHVSAVSVTGNTIAYRTINSFSPAVDLTGNGAYLLTGLQGSFTLATAPVGPGEQAPCGDCGGTYFSIEGGSLTATGSFGSIPISLDQMVGVTGASRPLLAAAAGPSQGVAWSGVYDLPSCSTSAPTTLQLEVALDRPAPASGARIGLALPAGSTLGVPAEVAVAPGRDTLLLPLTVPAGYAGSASIALASGGITSQLPVAIAGSCTAPTSKVALAPLVDPLVDGCHACTAFSAANSAGDRIVAVSGVVELLHGGALTNLAALFSGASAASAVAISDSGWVTGTVTVGTVTQAYRADLLHGAHQPTYLGYMTPAAITPSGIVVGDRIDPTTGLPRAVRNAGTGIVDLALTYAGGVLESRALYATDGFVAGTFVDNAGMPHGYLAFGGRTVLLPTVGANAPVPAGINALGTVVYNAGSSTAPLAMTYTPSGVSTRLGAPSGFVYFQPTGINKWGVVVGNAISSSGSTRAFAWRSGIGFTALSGYTHGLAVADAALAITDNNTIVVHGTPGSLPTRSQPADLYTITL